ncbi:DUF2381 family protein [Cystobacter fuscus]|uniref:DUF2381 family protein n=1 Tax=Cystobacter fuscus TaxID=43 RepID=UPI0012FDD36F|nr:DUF2381 family protein [Cystobacter fuscus]
MDRELTAAKRAFERFSRAARTSGQAAEVARGAEGLAQAGRASEAPLALSRVGPVLVALALLWPSNTAGPESDSRPPWVDAQREFEARLRDVSEASRQLMAELEAQPRAAKAPARKPSPQKQPASALVEEDDPRCKPIPLPRHLADNFDKHSPRSRKFLAEVKFPEIRREKMLAQAEARQCQEDKARLLAELKEPGGLMGAAWLEREMLVASDDISQALKHHPADALRTTGARSYSHPESMAVRLQLANPGAKPWTAAGAMLKDSTGAEVELSAWQASAIAPDTLGFVVVGTERQPGQFACPCTLRRWEAQGPRTVTLGNVTFPPVEQGGERE